MRILGIDTSCDETAAAVVEDGKKLLSNIIASQVAIHARYGGIVPEVASRQHILAIIPVVEKAMVESGTTPDNLDGVAVTCGPGLAGSLLVGVNMAKALSLAWARPLAGINHLEGHIYAAWLTGNTIEFPLICLIVSGGHSDLILMRGHGDYTLIGETRDDAAGDKAARILNLGYPGGPAIERAAKGAVPRLELPRARLKGTYDFSFSGLKTALLHLVEGGKIAPGGSGPEDDRPTVAETAASFQEAVISVLIEKTLLAAREFNVRQIIMAGGVAANRTLASRLTDAAPLPVIVPPPVLCTDNGAMIAAAAFYHFQSGKKTEMALDVLPGLRLV
jgi:N6-L-threonylcarbamoyladenine synthase